jgi:hypothetical protein
MEEPFVGTEAVASGALTPYQLRSRYKPIMPGIHLARDAEVTPRVRGKAAWLWSRRQGVLAGRSAAAMLRVKWIDATAPANIIYRNRHCPRGVRTWTDRIEDDEIIHIGGIPVTTPARTALDIACREEKHEAIAQIDALMNATDLKCGDVELLAQRYPGRRGIRQVTPVLKLVDGGAESPRETWARVALIEAGFPRPQTQIPVYDDGGYVVAKIDMGWEEIKVGVDYEGAHHRTDPKQFRRDLWRHEEVAALGWIDVRIAKGDSRTALIRRVADARARRA